MTNAPAILRSLLVYGICLPLAILLGVLLANPGDGTNLTWIGIILFVLVIPLFLRWHHAWLIAIWNTNMIFVFLPGAPSAWLFMAVMSFLIAMGQYILNRRIKFIHVPSVARPLIFLLGVVLVTCYFTGGFGLRSMGSDTYGGRRYVTILCAILGYFAIASQPILPNKRMLYVMLFLLGGLTELISATANMAPSNLSFLYLFFPPDRGGMSGSPDSPTGYYIARLGALCTGCMTAYYAMLARYGIAGIFNVRNLWRLLVFLLLVAVSLLGGFRGSLVLLIVTFSILFYLEGLVHTRLTPILILGVVLTGAIFLPFLDRLPLNVQRTLSFLPLPIDPVAKMDAEASSEWRITMWRHVVPQIPRYLIMGKGYSINSADTDFMSDTLVQSGNGTANTEVAGDYHNGPLTLIVPFGIFGTFAFLWFLAASIRVLLNNYRYGDPACRQINTFLLATFLAKTVIYFTIFGSFYTDLYQFTGLVALNISVNGGVASPAHVLQPRTAPSRLRLPAPRKKPAIVG